MSDLPPRLRRALEIVYAVEGVAGARVWELDDGTVAIGVRPSPLATPLELVRRVDKALDSLREDGGQWEVGLLDEVEEN
jgi:hypothetical protein